MNEAAAVIVKPKLKEPTPQEKLEFTIRMLKDLRQTVEGFDLLLERLLEMAFLQASDLRAGQVNASSRPEQLAKTA